MRNCPYLVNLRFHLGTEYLTTSSLVYQTSAEAGKPIRNAQHGSGGNTTISCSEHVPLSAPALSSVRSFVQSCHISRSSFEPQATSPVSSLSSWSVSIRH
jgi:hypothetical protein